MSSSEASLHPCRKVWSLIMWTSVSGRKVTEVHTVFVTKHQRILRCHQPLDAKISSISSWFSCWLVSFFTLAAEQLLTSSVAESLVFLFSLFERFFFKEVLTADSLNWSLSDLNRFLRRGFLLSTEEEARLVLWAGGDKIPKTSRLKICNFLWTLMITQKQTDVFFKPLLFKWTVVTWI